jgi:isopenicillin-N N-acyltransferase like protein
MGNSLSKSVRWAVVSWTTLLIVIVSLTPKVPACTLWSATGERVVGGGSLIGKNRDWVPDHRQYLELSSIYDPGYSYLGLIATGNQPGLKAGVNSKGLLVVTASPPHYLMTHKPFISRKVLAECKTVKEALSHRNGFVGPQFIMLADAYEIASIEVGLDGIFRVQSTKSGVLSHTNHYMEPDLVGLNHDKPGVSSVKRLKKIQQFLTDKEKFEITDFIQMSSSTDDGPDNSLWRTGSRLNSTRTLSTWIIHQPSSGEALLYLKMANPGKEIKEYRFELREVFKEKVNLSREWSESFYRSSLPYPLEPSWSKP